MGKQQIRPVNNRATDATAAPSSFHLYSDPLSSPPKEMASAAQLAALRQETFWANRSEINDAERDFYAAKSGAKGYSSSSSAASKNLHPKSNLAAEIAKARQHIKNSLDCVDNLAGMTGQANKQLTDEMKKLESENKALKKVTEDLKALVLKLEGRVEKLEKGGGGGGGATTNGTKPAAKDDDDDDVDLFGSDDEEEESEDAKRIREERLAAYHAKKSKKPAVIAKTSVLLDCKPWDDETDMNAMLKEVKKIQMDGLVWGASKLVPVGYGINKLQVMCVVEDERVSIDELQEKICDLEDYVQSCDVAAMNKI